MADKLEDFENVSVYTIDADRRETLLARGEECAVVWSTRDGWPIGVMHIYFWRDGRFWITCTQQRKRVPALRARPLLDDGWPFQAMPVQKVFTPYSPNGDLVPLVVDGARVGWGIGLCFS